MHNFRLQKFEDKHLIDDITINFLYSENFTTMENVGSKCNQVCC